MRIIRKDIKYVDPAPEDTIDEIEDLIDEDDLDEALLATNKALVKTPDSLELWVLKGEILSDMERYDGASIAYDKILEINPDFPEAWVHKSLALLALERFEDSLHAADKAIEHGLNDSGVLTVKATALLELERNDEAMEIIENVLEDDPKNISALDLRANIFSEMNRHDKAIEQLVEISDRDPWSVDTLVSLSGEYILAKNFSKALEVANRAITLAGNDHMAWGNKAEALYELGKTDEAIECILRAQNMDPSDDETWYQKARIFAQRDSDEALDSLLVAVSINPENKKMAQAEESFADFRQDVRFKRMIES